MKDLETQYRKLLIKDLKLAIKIKKIKYKMDMLDFWHLSIVEKNTNFEDWINEVIEMAKRHKKPKNPKEKIHI